MKVMVNDSIVHKSNGWLGIIESRIGVEYSVSRPDMGNQRERIRRDEFELLAEKIKNACVKGARFANGFSITGKSTISELVERFGYSTQRLRSNSLEKVLNQLRRAGLRIVGPDADGLWQRDDWFRLEIVDSNPAEQLHIQEQPRVEAQVGFPLPDPFWPRALGIDPRWELPFLRALSARDPMLCILWMPDDPETCTWLQATWEGLLSWAYRTAQRFEKMPLEEDECEVLVGPPLLLKNFCNTSPVCKSFDG